METPSLESSRNFANIKTTTWTKKIKIEKPKVQYGPPKGGEMGDFKIFNKDLYIIPNSFTLWDVGDNLFYQL